MATAKFVAALRCTAAAPLARSFSVTARATRGSRSSSLFSQRLAASAMVSQSKRRMLHSMTIVRADNAEEESPLPLPDDGAASAPLSPKVEKIVDDISGLTLLEVSSLVDALKDRLNIPDSAPMMMGSMPMMAGGVQPAPPVVMLRRRSLPRRRRILTSSSRALMPRARSKLSKR